MGGWAAGAEETLLFFRTWLMTTDREKGLGTSNYGGWSAAAFDRPAAAAITTMDEAARERLLRSASERALAEMPVIPIHFESAVWAMRKGLRYPGRVDQTTLAQQVRPE
jgi:peptide/nickel transport system substrate-binding protein